MWAGQTQDSCVLVCLNVCVSGHFLNYSLYKWNFESDYQCMQACRQYFLPISLPDMDGLLIHIVVFQRLLIQEVKEIFDCGWHHCPRAQHAAEEVIHKLLQCSLKEATNNVRQGRDREQRQNKSRRSYLLAMHR